jgi:hypothetical protein
MSDGPSRRGMLSAVAALSLTVVGTGVAAQAPADDPILAAIVSHRKAYDTWESEVHCNFRLQEELPIERQRTLIYADGEENVVESDDPRWIASERAVAKSYNIRYEAAFALANIEPTSIAGVVALLDYYVEVAVRETHHYACYWPEDLTEDPNGDGPALPLHHFVMTNVAHALEQIRRKAVS